MEKSIAIFMCHTTSAPSSDVSSIDYSDSQVPPCEDYIFHDSEYPIEAYAS